MYQLTKPLLTRCLSTILLCLLSLTHKSYCTTQEVLGLKLDPMYQKLYEDKAGGDTSNQSSAEYFDQLLETVPFRTSTSELVTICFPPDFPLSGSQIHDVNTDNDDIDNLNVVKLGKKRKKPYNASRSLYAQKEGLTNNYLKQSDLPQQGETSADSVKLHKQYTQGLCCRSVLDALRIVEAHSREQTRASTVCLCVVLRNKDGYAKRFIFHNGPSSLHSSMREEANRLRYHIVHAEHAHAEGEFVQFLLKRNAKAAEETYTHVIGMGCSRQHCKECNCLFKLALGALYYDFTASIRDARDEKDEVEIALASSTEDEVLINRSRQGTSQILYGESASSGTYFNQFSLRKILSAWVEKITNIKVPYVKRYNNTGDAQKSST